MGAGRTSRPREKEQALAEGITDVTTDTWEEEVEKSDLPVLVDFWAIWCPPCVRLAPTVEQLAKDFAGRLKVCKLDVSENENLAVRYHVMNIPYLAIFRGGSVVSATAGVKDKATLAGWIESTIRPSQPKAASAE